eukprot:3935392-Rhodomonas_salina.2
MLAFLHLNNPSQQHRSLEQRVVSSDIPAISPRDLCEAAGRVLDHSVDQHGPLYSPRALQLAQRHPLDLLLHIHAHATSDALRRSPQRHPHLLPPLPRHDPHCA